ncbi:MAG: hypothetical protein HUJ52_02685 [Malacoplasma sp.]|nr:hypothetical protein [Malacoplasma sp.]
MNDIEIKQAEQEEKKDVDKLATLYQNGKESKAKTKHDKVYNFLVVLFTSIIVVCIAVIVGYIIAIKC